MAQIGFTHKTEPVYDRFQDMRRAYEDAHGRTYAPGFLTVLMDAFEGRKGFVIRKKDNHGLFVLDRKHACDPNAIFTMVKSEALVFETEFEAEDFGFVNNGWLQGFEVAPFEPENETK